ncbi:hypothetical protein [Mycoplasma sp. P36-A1]|uniref:hypothetical protein n=1 Tax=Mycoplasma sp. P36-A1 TaxID=3252900 RepID=UPI003C2F1182
MINDYCNIDKVPDIDDNQELKTNLNNKFYDAIKEYELIYDEQSLACYKNDEQIYANHFFTNKRAKTSAIFIGITSNSIEDINLEKLNKALKKFSKHEITLKDLANMTRDTPLVLHNKCVYYLEKISNGYIITIN